MDHLPHTPPSTATAGLKRAGLGLEAFTLGWNIIGVVLLAMLAAKGTSVLRSVYVIHRGYEDLAERLNALGAQIETFRDI